MSELKDYDIMDIEAMDDERLEKSESGKIQATRVYIKSEADKVIAELKARIAELEEERRWRKCSEEKPGNEQKVLVWLTAGGHYGFVLTSMYIDGQWFYGEDPQGCKPSHWKPLPSAPKEGE